MKTIFTLLLAGALAIPAFAQTPAAKDKPVAPVISVEKAVLTGPFVLKDGAISQPAQTELPDGGKAVITFTVPADGNYVIHAVVKAPAEDANSFYLNIDGEPTDPLTIWDVEVTENAFLERIVSWRGNGSAEADEFAPKVFKLTAGEHKLIVMGREPAFLKSVSVRPAPAAK